MSGLVKKSLDLECKDEAEAAFEMTKVELWSDPVLALPRPEGTFVLDTDAANDLTLGHFIKNRM